MLHPFSKSTLLCIFSFLFLSACNESTSSSQGDGYGDGNEVATGFNEKALISNLADLVSTTISAFADHSDMLEESVTTYCQALVESSVVDDELALARSTWQGSMALWQQVDMMQMGPLLATEGKLRDDIYSWPDIYTCGVDFDTMYFQAGEFNGEPYNIEERRGNRKGLYALEYLLFNDSNDHSCIASTPDNWYDFSAEQIVLARCEYAGAVASDIVLNANVLVEQWSGEDGYLNELKNAGTELSTIASTHDAVNLLSDALFYLDSITKDAKLATPLGLVSNSCGAQACPQDVESAYANHSVENILENLNAFELFFTGDDGIGFVDYLEYVGDTATAEAMTTAITNAKAQLALYEESLAEMLASDEARVEQTHQNVKAITDELKTDFIESLALALPQTSAGDND